MLARAKKSVSGFVAIFTENVGAALHGADLDRRFAWKDDAL
jgi:hypothetical protein